MAASDRAAQAPAAALRERHRAALERFLACLLAQDARTLEVLLAESVRATTDAAGRYTALARPLAGRGAVARLVLRAAAMRRAASPSYEIRQVNGLPAILIALAAPERRQAPRTVLSLDVDADGRIRALYAVLAPRKLGAVRF
jgi:RNA polymerase sigma-70 factor (ECF subfamily)